MRGHGAHGHEEIGRKIIGRIADDHGNGDRFAHGAADAQNEGGKDAAFCRRNADLEDRLRLGVAEGKRAFVIFRGNGFQSVFGERSDRGHDHDGQDQYRRKHASSDGHAEHSLQHGHDDDQPEKPVDDGRDARKQVDDLIVRPFELLGAVIDHEDRRTDPQKPADDDRPERNDDGGNDGRQDPEGIGRGPSVVKVMFGKPQRLEQEVEEPDVAEGGNAGNQKVDNDGEHRDHREHRRDQEDRPCALLAVQLELQLFFFTANGG